MRTSGPPDPSGVARRRAERVSRCVARCPAPAHSASSASSADNRHSAFRSSTSSARLALSILFLPALTGCLGVADGWAVYEVQGTIFDGASGRTTVEDCCCYSCAGSPPVEGVDECEALP